MGLAQLPQVVWDSRWDSEMESQRGPSYPKPLDSCELLERHLGLSVFSLSKNGVMKQLMGAGRACAPISAHVSLSITSWLVSQGQSIQIWIMGGGKWCMKPIQSCPLRFLGFVCTGHIHLSQVTVFFLSAVSAMSHIYSSSGITAVVLVEQGPCVCRA